MMIIKQDKLKHFLEAKKLSKNEFAIMLDVEQSEVEKMLNGKQVGIFTARKFVKFFKADLAQHYIDWEKMNIKNPLEN